MTEARVLGDAAIRSAAGSVSSASSRSVTILLVYLAIALAVGVGVAVWVVRTILQPAHALLRHLIDLDTRQMPG